ncbi:hypothetical protein [Agathobaculum desmolans]|uniref:hypothetical protein n=1 Tax=Agathobaculum desmolans TaxID=39484 RepID=UPI00248F3CE6|nr:hypothetical protein [Agathobaculum desmolans]
MKHFRYRGKRIRPSDKDLVFQAACGVGLTVFFLSFVLLNLWNILQSRWRGWFVSGVGGHRVYLLFTTFAAVVSAVAMIVLLRRLFPDAVRQLMHRQKLARMVLENQWYEQAEQTTQQGFFKDLPHTRTKIARFPRMYYRMENGLLHIQVEITMGRYQEALLHLESKLESGLYAGQVYRQYSGAA